ncbi:MAG TPA: hypothetical protein VNH11_30910 [Pirellulales bacterium]|nr:hypothetical protein [Pirellulales bacterium]
MKLDEAEQALATGVSLFEQLVAERPHQPDLRKTLADAVKARAINSVRRGVAGEAVAGLDRAVQIMGTLVAEAADNEQFRLELTDPEIFDSYLWCGKYDQAVAFLAEARKQFRRMPNPRPGIGPWAPNRAGCLTSTYPAAGNVLARLGKYEAVVELIAELVSQSELEGARVGVLRLSECLAREVSRDERIDASRRSSLLAAALTAAAECLASCDAERIAPGDCNSIGWFLATTDVPALRDAGRSLYFAEAAVRRSPDRRSINTLGAACYYAGRWDDARRNLLRCLELDAPHGFDLFLLAMTFWQLGEKEQARQWFDRGASWRPRCFEVDHDVTPFRREAERLLGIAGARSSTEQRASTDNR